MVIEVNKDIDYKVIIKYVHKILNKNVQML